MEYFELQVINEDGQPVFEVMYKEKVTKLTPVEVATAIYKKMMGMYVLSAFLDTVYMLTLLVCAVLY